MSIDEQFFNDVVAGLSAPQKRLPPKYFYDDAGSQLFDSICEVDEYYLTRTELSIMRESIYAMADWIGPRCLLIEFGSGSSVKTRLLLDGLDAIAGYVPVDIAEGHLMQTAAELRQQYPDIEVVPVCADFASPFEVPKAAKSERRRIVYFPGSTIGNSTPPQARGLLRRIAEMARPGGGLLLGIDLAKDPAILDAAYNDGTGITAQFNLNVLRRINRELGGDFDLSQFRHQAAYNPAEGRVEIYLVSQRPQTVRVGSHRFTFASEERICTEYSYKYDLEEFSSFAGECGWRVDRAWTDQRRWFAVLGLSSEL